MDIVTIENGSLPNYNCSKFEGIHVLVHLCSIPIVFNVPYFCLLNGIHVFFSEMKTFVWYVSLSLVVCSAYRMVRGASRRDGICQMTRNTDGHSYGIPELATWVHPWI